MRFSRVGVIFGGISAERKVSLKSGRAVADGLRRSGYDVVEIDAEGDLVARLAAAKVEAVYIALHGRWGEDGTVQGLLELARIPYTGSSVLASAACMDKLIARSVLQANRLPVAEGCRIRPGQPLTPPERFGPPWVVKPADEGSSVGVSIVDSASAYRKAAKAAFALSDRVLVERFVAGAEVTVAVLDGKALGALEVEPHRPFYDYDAKYKEGGSTHHVPPRIAPGRVKKLEALAERAYDALACAGAARVDFIAPPKARPIILEINTIPGMTERSLLPEIALSKGISFDALVSRIMESAALHIGSKA